MKYLFAVMLILAACKNPAAIKNDSNAVKPCVQGGDLGPGESCTISVSLAPRGCLLPKGQPRITLPLNGGVKFPDGFIYECNEDGLRVMEDPLEHMKSPGTVSIWQSGGRICRIHEGEDISGVVCDEKRAAEDAKTDGRKH